MTSNVYAGGNQEMEQQGAFTIEAGYPASRVNKKLYVWSFIISAVISNLLCLWTMATSPQDFDAIGFQYVLSGVTLNLVTFFFTVYSLAVFLILLYKAWQVIQDGNQRMPPLRALGFMFIPFYDLYWMFPAFWGYAKDYNSYLVRYQLTLKKLPANLFLAASILSVSSFFTSTISLIPGLFLSSWIITSLINMAGIAIFALVINELCNAINQLSYGDDLKRKGPFEFLATWIRKLI
jgi:uncharacterized membrane protein